MSYASRMVHLDAEQNSKKRSRIAIDLAERFDATLIGIAGWSFIPVRLSGGSATSDARSDPEREEMRAILDGMGRAFCAAAKHHAEGIASIDLFVVRRLRFSSSLHVLFLVTNADGCCGLR
jgi:hypothetical protein